MVGSSTQDGISFVTTESTSFTKPSLSLTYLPAVTGDYDGNGTVEPEDYAAWRSNFGAAGASAADGNGNGTVDAADYVLWRSRSGQSTGSGASAAAVPEPTTLTLLFATLFVAAAPLQTQIRRTRNHNPPLAV